MVGLVERMPVRAFGLRLTAYGPDEDGIRFAEGAAGSVRPVSGDMAP
jgi:hypothetical protein